ncbi:cytochrome b/b6 domain-containing protein [Roseospirillum parvum]|uniref:Cytochrome b n=1 Tax=Roseospirillum parvum TaxID=83401 RepID=A0A1G8AJG5_9PROT|nr:cytochrome b/b6 domain-containing protein [Roseospirillum parvum]SDH20946.1 Cytochrome b [Roseospirillum parvum]
MSTPDTETDTPTPDENGEVPVWDPLVRIGHWVLVGGFLIAYLTEGEPEAVHVWAGYAVALTVAIRVVWGFIGPRHALFADFVRSPITAARYLKDELTGSARRFIGHNPAGGLMAVALLVCLAGTAWTGMGLYAVEEGKGPLAGMVSQQQAGLELAVVSPAMADDDEHEYGAREDHGKSHGEGEEVWEEWHEVFANLTLALMVLHILGVMVSSTTHKENLVQSMITGRKRA